jgi:sulfur-oxidizing protein SoxZ
MARVLVVLPAQARRGEVVEVRVTIAHPMETGYRPGADGKPLPRDILRRFACRYDGAVVFEAELHPAISANPYLAFHLLATTTGPVEFGWDGDNGFAQLERRVLTVV